MEFSQEDLNWILSDPEIQLGKELGSGAVGRVYALENRPDLVIKVPSNLLPQTDLDKRVSVDTRTQFSRKYLKKELENYSKVKNYNIICPTQPVKLGLKTNSGEDYIGLVRPKLKTSYSTLKTLLSDAQLFDLKESLINLSKAEYMIFGVLPVGIDQSGKLLLFDIGSESFIRSTDKEKVFRYNNKAWKLFLFCIRKSLRFYGALS